MSLIAVAVPFAKAEGAQRPQLDEQMPDGSRHDPDRHTGDPHRRAQDDGEERREETEDEREKQLHAEFGGAFLGALPAFRA